MNLKQRYLLDYLKEECSEVTHAACKVTRFGSDEDFKQSGQTNKEALIAELNDLAGVVRILQDEGVLPTFVYCEEKICAKVAQIRQLMVEEDVV